MRTTHREPFLSVSGAPVRSRVPSFVPNSYNNGQNPFVAAQNFIDKHELPQSYLNQIADHLTKMAGGTTPTIG